MADDSIEHCGQGELSRCEVTHTRTSSAVWLTTVISRPSGKGNNADEGINFLEKRFLGWLEQIFEEIPQNITFASPKSWKSQKYAGVDIPRKKHLSRLPQSVRQRLHKWLIGSLLKKNSAWSGNKAT